MPLRIKLVSDSLNEPGTGCGLVAGAAVVAGLLVVPLLPESELELLLLLLLLLLLFA